VHKEKIGGVAEFPQGGGGGVFLVKGGPKEGKKEKSQQKQKAKRGNPILKGDNTDQKHVKTPQKKGVGGKERPATIVNENGFSCMGQLTKSRGQKLKSKQRLKTSPTNKA